MNHPACDARHRSFQPQRIGLKVRITGPFAFRFGFQRIEVVVHTADLRRSAWCVHRFAGLVTFDPGAVLVPVGGRIGDVLGAGQIAIVRHYPIAQTTVAVQRER